MTERRHPTPGEHSHFDELAVGHALSALEPADEVAFVTHLPSCAHCERSVAEHALTLSHLAYGAQDAEPPASLLEGIRAGITASGRAGDFPVPLSLDVARRRRRVSPVVLRRASALTGIAAAAALVVSLSATNASLRQDQRSQAAVSARLAGTVATLTADGARSVRLTDGSRTVKAVVVSSGSTVSLVVDGLAPNASNSTYVLWAKSSFGDVRAVGAFDVTHAGVDVVRGLQLSPGSGTVQRFVITREQGRTAPALSTQPPVVSGDVV